MENQEQIENKAIKWRVWINKNSLPLIIEVPFFSVHNAHDFISKQVGKRVVSMERL